MAKNTLSPEEEAKVLGYVNDFVSDVEAATSRLRRTWLTLYKNYRIFQMEGKQSWQSNLWIPKTFTAIEQIASRTTAHNPKFDLVALQSSSLQFFTSNQEEIDEAIATNKEAELNPALTPVEVPEADVMSSRDVLSAYLSWAFTEKKLKKLIRLWDKGRLIYGSYHVKVDIDVLTESREREEERDGETVTIKEDVFKNVLPEINTIDIFDFLIHPLEANGIDAAYAVGHKRDEAKISEFDEETYFNLDKIDPSRSKDDTFSEELQKDQVVANEVQKRIDPNSFTAIEVWGRLSLTGEQEDEKEYIITVANGQQVIRFEENKHTDSQGKTIRPFVAMHDQPVPGEYYAIGEAEPIMSLQKEMNDLRNTRADFNMSVLYPEWLVRNESGINPTQLVHKPNNIILTDDLDAIRPVPKDNVPISSYNEENALNVDIQDTTSTTNFAQPGATSAFTDTASGAAMRQQEQNTRMKLKIEYLDDAVSELGRKILLFAKDSIEDSIEIPNEDEFITVFKDNFKQMAQGFSPVVVSGSMAADTPEERRNEAIARGNISVQYFDKGVPVNLTEEYKNVMEKFGVEDTSKLLIDQPAAAPAAAPAAQPII